MTKYAYVITNGDVERAVRKMFKTSEGFYEACANPLINDDGTISICATDDSIVAGVYITFNQDDYERVSTEYDNKSWNSVKYVNPPETGWYRVFNISPSVLYWDNEQQMWLEGPAGLEVPSYAFSEDARFKPWDDKE